MPRQASITGLALAEKTHRTVGGASFNDSSERFLGMILLSARKHYYRYSNGLNFISASCFLILTSALRSDGSSDCGGAWRLNDEPARRSM